MSRINRNIVECKDSFFDCPLVPLLVLIETLWNVKSVDHLQVDFSLRINRNIVECKEDQPPGSPLIQEGINRNIVECKDV